MSPCLLDVNVLIALIDPMHVHHQIAQDWFGSEGSAAWATCPLTQNGVLRIVGHRSYGNSPGSPAIVAQTLGAFLAHPGHEFWPDDLSLISTDFVDPGRLSRSDRVTDTYLLSLAVSKAGLFATFDAKLSTLAVRDGASAVRIIR